MSNIAILTNFTKFDPWYSLTGIVQDQARMLTEYGHIVTVFTDERYDHGSKVSNVRYRNSIPQGNLHDYQDGEPLTPEHESLTNDTAFILQRDFELFKIDTVFTHDLIFQGWNKPYGIGIQRASTKLPGINWFHWVHSIPSQYKDWWNLTDYGPGHWIVYPNKTDAIRVAEAYRTDLSHVKIIPHIKDLRIMFDFSQITCNLLDEIPALMQADVVQIYPASADRFEAKGVSKVIKILGNIKLMGHSVCLFIANQWATTAKHRADISEYQTIARHAGLVPGKDVFFSSGLGDYDFKLGVPWAQLRELMQLSNLFVFPTTHETFGLVLPEVSLCSGALCVLNKSLAMQVEISGHNTLFFDFGSYTHGFEPEDPEDYLRQVAMIIMGRMQENDGILTRTFIRKRYNFDNLYTKFYGPIMAETRLHP